VESELPAGSDGSVIGLLDVLVTDRYTGLQRDLRPNGGRITATGAVPAEVLSLGALKGRY
jgi:hypothetical protein